MKTRSIPYFYVSPAFLILGLVVILPFLYNLVLSFSNMNLTHFRDWDFVGFKQYGKVFSEPIFYIVLLKTFIWTAVNVVFHVGFGVMLALILNTNIRFKNFWRIILILPWAVPQMITALTWRGMFNYQYGAVNLIIKKIDGFLHGIFGIFSTADVGNIIEPVAWLSGEATAFIACIITNVWLGFPFMMIVALGALQSIPKSLYEATSIDGASKFQQFRHITIPFLKPVMMPAIVLGVIWTFNNLNVMWLVSNGGNPSDKTHILVSFVYKAVFNHYRYGYAAALSLVIFLILLAIGWTMLKKTNAAKGVAE